MPTIYDIVNSKNITAYWEVAKQSRRPYLLEGFFPDKKQLGTKIEWIKGAKSAPVMLMPSSFDAKVIPISRDGIEVQAEKMPLFKNSKLINEDMRQKFNLLAGNNSDALSIMASELFDDSTSLLENAALTREILRSQVITTGAISLASNGQNLTYDYGVPASHKKTPTVKWDVAASADPIADIQAWALEIENETGVAVTEMLLNSVTLSYIQKATSVKNIAFANGANMPGGVNRGRIIELIKAETGINILVYDKGYKNASGTFTKFVADGTVVLMPGEALGNTVFGTTPEESDLMNGVGTKASVSVTDTGVAVSTYKEEDPVTVVTKVSEICLPSFERGNEIIIASVKTA